MNRAHSFAGLPEHLAPPEKTVDAIVALPTLAEREAYWLLVPEGWRKAIGHLVEIRLGMVISELPDLEQRRQALEQVPPIWLEAVRWHTRRLYNTRGVRAEYQAELAAERARDGASA